MTDLEYAHKLAEILPPEKLSRLYNYLDKSIQKDGIVSMTMYFILRDLAPLCVPYKELTKEEFRICAKELKNLLINSEVK